MTDGLPPAAEPKVHKDFEETHQAPPVKTVRLRFWNTRTRDGRHTHISPEDALFLVDKMNEEFYSQCWEYETPIFLELAAVGSFLVPAHCWDPDMALDGQPARDDCRFYWNRQKGLSLNRQVGNAGFVNVVVHPRWRFVNGGNSFLGHAEGVPGVGLHVAQDDLFQWGWGPWVEVLSHELGHCLGGYPEDAHVIG